MIPSNMLLKPLNQVIEGYNNKIVVNTCGAELRKSVYTSKPVVHPSEVHTSKVHTSEEVPSYRFTTTCDNTPFTHT